MIACDTVPYDEGLAQYDDHSCLYRKLLGYGISAFQKTHWPWATIIPPPPLLGQCR